MSPEELPEHDGASDLVRALSKSKETPFISALQWALLFCSYSFSCIHISQCRDNMERKGKEEREKRGEKKE